VEQGIPSVFERFQRDLADYESSQKAGGTPSATRTKHFQVKYRKQTIQHRFVPFKGNMESPELKLAQGEWFSFAERGTPALTAYARLVYHFTTQFDQILMQDPELHTMVFPFNAHGLFLL
jgi:hypothetical protein